MFFENRIEESRGHYLLFLFLNAAKAKMPEPRFSEVFF